MEIIMTFSTMVVTLLLGFLSKKFDIVESNKIPIQNILIGILAGLLVFACRLSDNLFISILSCFAGSMCAGGVYDASKTKFGSDEIEDK